MSDLPKTRAEAEALIHEAEVWTVPQEGNGDLMTGLDDYEWKQLLALARLGASVVGEGEK